MGDILAGIPLSESRRIDLSRGNWTDNGDSAVREYDTFFTANVPSRFQIQKLGMLTRRSNYDEDRLMLGEDKTL